MLPVSGWVAGSMTAITCEGHTWLALDPYESGVETLAVVELVSDAPLAPRRVWRQVDPAPSGGEGSRPGRVLYAACGPGRIGLAMQLAIARTTKPDPARTDEPTAPAVLLVEWRNP